MTWKGKTKGGVFGYKAFIFVLKFFGIKVAYLLLRFVVLYYLLFSVKSTRIAFRFYRRRLGFSLMKSWYSVFRNYYIFGQTLIDKVAVMGDFAGYFSMKHEGSDHLVNISKEEKGGIFISGHIGNYEMAGHLLKKLDSRVNIVMFDQEHEKIKGILTEIYGERPINIIPVKPDDFSHIFEISNALKRNEVICIHGDRFVEGAKTVSCEFMGEQALFPVGPFLLVQKLKVPYSFVFAVKEGAKEYHFFATPAKKPTGTVEDILKEYVNELEKMVLRYPEQWFNFYDFWHHSHPNKKNIAAVLQSDRAA